MRFKSLLILLSFLILNCTREANKNIVLSNYVTSNAIAAIKVNRLSSLRDSLDKNDFLERFEHIELYKTILEKVSLLEHIHQESSGILVFSRSEKDSVEFLFVSENLSNIFGIDSLQNKYSEIVTFQGNKQRKYIVDDNEVYSKITDDILYVSSSSEILDGATDVPIKNTGNEAFKKLYEVADPTQPLSIFINMAQMDPLLKGHTKVASEIKIAKFADWMSLDLDCRQDQFAFKGLSLANDSLPNYLNLFKNTHPLPNVTASFAPLQAEAILSYSFDDFRVFEANRQHYLNTTKVADSLFDEVEEIGHIYLNDEKAIILNTYGSQNIANFLAGIRKNAIDYQGTIILEHTETDFLNKALHPLVYNFEANFSTVLENAFLFSAKREVLETIVSSYKNGITFNKSPVFSANEASITTSATLQFISNAEHAEQLLIENFNSIYQNLNGQKLAGYTFTAQVVADKNFFYTNMSANKLDKSSPVKIIEPLFNLTLEGDLATDPQFVTNHITKEKEIVVQDNNNMLYLISNTGKILWKKQLAGIIQGGIQQVDLFKNGRLQLAFTTHDQFLILDRNGKEVNPFTFKYEGGNLNPLAVFDYEDKKNYRFVVTQGEKVFMYDSKGTIVKGFKYTRAEAPILAAPKHMVVGNKDYLVFKLADGALKLLNRVGDVRIKFNSKIDFSENEIYLYKDKFATTDKKGVLHQIDTKGRSSNTAFNLNKDHGLDATNNTLVYMNDNVLSIKGKTIELDLGVYTKPKIFYINDKIYVSVTDIQNQKVYLYDSQAKPIPNFPVFGTSLIDLNDFNKNKKMAIVVKEENNSIIIYTF